LKRTTKKKKGIQGVQIGQRKLKWEKKILGNLEKPWGDVGNRPFEEYDEVGRKRKKVTVWTGREGLTAPKEKTKDMFTKKGEGGGPSCSSNIAFRGGKRGLRKERNPTRGHPKPTKYKGEYHVHRKNQNEGKKFRTKNPREIGRK